MSFAAAGCGGDGGTNAIDAGSTSIDAKVIDAGSAVDAAAIDAKVIDAGAVDAAAIDAKVFDAPPQIDAKVIDAGPVIDGPCALDPVCGSKTSGTVCSNGAVFSCSANPQTSCAVSTHVQDCTGGLVCAINNETQEAFCACPDPSGPVTAGGGCPALEEIECSVESDQVTCATQQLGPQGGQQACSIWTVTHDCHAAHVTCDATAKDCACPSNAANPTVFANPNAPTRDPAVAPTGVQTPSVCAFPTIHEALASAVTKSGAAPAGKFAVVLSGGTAERPAIFVNEGTAWPLVIPENITLTVDYDTRTAGITPAAGTFDPRFNIILVTPAVGVSPAAGVHLTSNGGAGGQAYGFTVAAGPCIDEGGAVNCTTTGTTALLVDSDGADAIPTNGGAARARVDSVFLEGGGGNVLAQGAGAAGDMSLTLNAPTGTATIPCSGDLAPSFITVYDVLGVFGPVTNHTFANGTCTFTFFTNRTSPMAAVSRWSVQTSGVVSTGLKLRSAGGSVHGVVAENLDEGIDVETASTSDAGYFVTGVNAFNNITGIFAEDGLLTLAGDAQFAVTGFSFASPTIEHSAGVGLLASAGRVVATNLVVKTGGDQGVGVFGGGSASLTGGSVTGNAESGVLVSATSPTLSFAANGTVFSGNLNGVRVLEGNTTITASTISNNNTDANASVGLWVNGASSGTTVAVHGGTITGNSVGVMASAGIGGDVKLVLDGSLQVTGSELQGLAANYGALTITNTTFSGNGVGAHHFCDQGSTKSVNSPALSISGSAVVAFSGAQVINNLGGGAAITTTTDAVHTAVGSAFSNNGTSANDCSENFSGLLVTADELDLTGATSVANSNRNGGNGFEVGGNLVDHSTGLVAIGNSGSGVKIDANGVADLQRTTALSGGVVTNNCQSNPSSTCAGIESRGAVTIAGPSAAFSIQNNAGFGVWVSSSGATSITNAIVSGNTKDGVRLLGSGAGAIESSTINQNANGVLVQTTNTTTIHDVSLSGNTGTGLIVSQTAVGVNDFANDTPISAWGLTLNASLVSGNGVGVAIGGGDSGQNGNITALIENSYIGLNNGIGVSAVGGAPGGSKRTGVTIASNQIEQNVGSGLVINQAFVKDEVSGQATFKGISSNIIAHNGYPLSDSTCAATETAAQIVFSGSDPLPTGGSATACTACGGGTCTQGVCNSTPHCIWVSDATGCQRGYQLHGATNGDNQANSILNYQPSGHSAPTSGLSAATAGTYVDARGNIWRQAPSNGFDFVTVNGAAIVADPISGVNNNTCVLFSPPAIP